MPRKKNAHQADAEPSTQPLKKFKADTSESGNDDEPIGRRSLRARAQDENKADCTTRQTRGSAKQQENELPITSNRPRRTALQATDEKVVTRGAGFVMKSLSPKAAASCPLEVSVQVTPCDLTDRIDKVTAADTGSRKRKGKASPRSEEKKAKLLATNSSVNKRNSMSPSQQSKDLESKESTSNHSLSECSVSLDMDSSVTSAVKDTLAKYMASLARNDSSLGGQEGLPKVLPPASADPIFTRTTATLERSTINGADLEHTFSAVTYNILADCHRSRWNDAYDFTDELHLHMDYRGYRIIEEIKNLDSDIVCLQEVDEEFYRDTLVKHMHMLGYDGLFYRRKGEDYPEGASTFYKTSQFTLMEHHTFSYTQLVNQDIDKLEHTDDVKDRIRQHVDREAVLLVCRLRHNSSDKQVVVGNTHLTWTQFIDVDIPCMQASYAFKVMSRLSNHGEIPFVLCGDFNTRTSDPAYQLAMEGYLNDAGIKTLQKLDTIKLPDGSQRSLVDLFWCAFQHPARNIASSYYTVQGEEPEITSKNPVMNNCVDYIWTSQLQTTSVTRVNKIEHSMPNIIYPSDHVSLRAAYVF